MATGGNKKVANSLVSLSSAAILVVYAAGFLKTRAAAEKMDDASNARRPSMPAPATAGETRTPPQIEPTTNMVKATDLTSPMMPAPESKTVVATATTATAVAIAPATTKTVTTAATNAPNAPSVTNSTNPKSLPEQNPTNPAPEVAKPAEDKPAPELLMPKEKYKDGTYLGWGTCRHGDIQAQVIIQDGRIAAASISQCWTRYSCSWVAHLPPQVVARQGPDVDYVSGATQSANAFYWAVIDALAKAKGPQVRRHDPR